MPKAPAGVYQSSDRSWYFKAHLGRDELTGKRVQVTRRGYRSAREAAAARAELLARRPKAVRSTNSALTVDQLLDQYLDGLDADGRLSVKTRFDYRHNADNYVRPILGSRRVTSVTPELISKWQRKLSESGGTKSGSGLSANTVRLARAPLAGAFKLAVAQGLITSDPVAVTARPAKRRSVPKHWTPDQARAFIAFQEGDREWPLWVFLLSSGLRVGELVALRWDNVDLTQRRAIVSEFVSTLGYEVVASTGKSRTSTRPIDLDDQLVEVLKLRRRQQAEELQQAADGRSSEFVFCREHGQPYHPQTVSRRLGRLSQQAGVPRLTAHGLRHTSATLMLDSGVHPKVAAERLGHANPGLFMALYSHVTPTMQRDAADRLGAALLG